MDQNSLTVLLVAIMAVLVIVLVCLWATKRRDKAYPPEVKKETSEKSTGDTKTEKAEKEKKSSLIINLSEEKKIEEEAIRRESASAPRPRGKEEADFLLRYEPKARACWVCRLCGAENVSEVRHCGVCGAERMGMR